MDKITQPQEWIYVAGQGYWSSDLDGADEPIWISAEEESEQELLKSIEVLLDAQEVSE